MNNLNKRNFYEGEGIYVIDVWIGLAVATSAKITRVEKEEDSFVAHIYGLKERRYRFDDYGKLVFGNVNEAAEALTKLPTKDKVVYQIIGKRIYLKSVVSLEEVADYYNNIVLVFDKGNPISIKEIGNTVFLNLKQAEEKLKNN